MSASSHTPPRSPQGDAENNIAAPEAVASEQAASGGLFEFFANRLNLHELFSVLTSFGLFFGELDSRKPLREALAEATAKPSPSYIRGFRVLGLLMVVLLVIEGLTGVLLALYYLPTTDGAHVSIGTIMRDVHFGGLVHQMHFWGAQLLIAILILRVLRFYAQRVYEPPRELFWVVSALLLLVVFHIDMTGRTLPWTSTAYWCSVRAMEILESVPVYGNVWAFLLGADGPMLSDLTLIRSYVLHILVLPGMAMGLVYLHFSGVRRVGLREIDGEEPKAGGLSLPRHFLNLAILVVLVVGVLVSLAILTPTTYEPAADPFTTVPGVGPAWYLLAPFGFLELTSFMPRSVGGALIFLGFTAFILMPFLRRRKPREGSGIDPVALGLGLLVFAVWLALTYYGARVA